MTHSNIFRTASGKLVPVLVLLSLVVLYRGHNNPGGGFIGGLLASSAYILYAMAHGAKAARRKLKLTPHGLMASGLSVILISTLWGIVAGKSALTGLWVDIDPPLLPAIHLGTPMLFDFGVYLTVIGVLLLIMVSIMEEK